MDDERIFVMGFRSGINGVTLGTGSPGEGPQSLPYLDGWAAGHRLRMLLEYHENQGEKVEDARARNPELRQQVADALGRLAELVDPNQKR